jgi:hypothetical protein
MTNTQKQLLSKILNYVMLMEESHYEESGCNENHIYNLARTLWLEFELDFQEAE